ncbi:MAG: class I SAM-dependent methyltransferase [Thermoleophilia bacterium]
MNFQRLYEYRFRDIDQDDRTAVWQEIAPFVHRTMGSPQRVLDPAAGRCEFINAISAEERWAIDQTDYAERSAGEGVTTVVADIFDVDLPQEHFDGVWVSNFLEHLLTQEQTAEFLERMNRAMAPGGRIAIMGPNFRYCAREYFDCADHTLVYTHTSIAEHLYAAGFEPDVVVPRFLPYSFRGRLPATPGMTRLYLRARPAWRILGKQFLVIGKRV